MQHKIIQLENEVQGSLSKLNLNVNVLVEIIQKEHLARTNATLNHPISAPESMAYFETVRSLRDFLYPLGWERKEIRNLSITYNPKNAVSIIVFSGNKNTGTEKTPKSRNPKGSQAQLYINQNNIDITGQPRSNIYEFTTWVLMYFYEKNYQIRSELSLPISMTPRESENDNSKQYINGWGERIILPPIWLTEKPLYSSQNQTSLEFDSSEHENSIDMPIKRRKK